MNIRDEAQADRGGVREVNCRAFPSPAEADLVDRLREDGAIRASVVAVSEHRIVAHALFSAAHLELDARTIAIGALGPVAVLPEWQNRGVGSAVIRAGLERCWALDLPAVIVLGHPEYYARFGFVRADKWAIRSELDVPLEAFMIAWKTTPLAGPGLAKYHAAFNSV